VCSSDLQELRAERLAADERCDALSQELARVTQAFTDHLAALPAQLEAAVAAAVTARPAAEIAPEPRLAVAPPIAFAAAEAWASAKLPFPSPVPPIAFAAAAAWAAAELPFAEREPAAWSPVPPIAFVAAIVPAARAVPKLFPAPPPIARVAAAAWARAELPFASDPLDQLELAICAGPRAAVAADESGDQLAFALDVERAPRFARPCENQLAFALEAPATNADQLVISTPPPGPRWDTPPQSVVVRRRTGGLVGRAISLLAA